MSSGDIISIGGEVDAAHFMDEDQAEAQIALCEALLKEEQASGKAVGERLRLLEDARYFLQNGLFTRAFLAAIRARGIAVERLP